MEYQVARKQPNSNMCLVCGMHNALGLKAFFYELDNDELLAVFTPKEEHQSYPGGMHGGVAATILDEAIGRAIMMRYNDDVWGVTMEFTSRYKKPVPLNEELRVLCRITSENRRVFEGTGEILLPDGTVAVEGRGEYLKMTLQQISDADTDHLGWQVIPSSHDLKTVTL